MKFTNGSTQHLDYMYAETLSDLNKAARAFRMLLSSPESLDPKEQEELTGIQNLIYQTALLVGLRIEMVGLYPILQNFRFYYYIFFNVKLPCLDGVSKRCLRRIYIDNLEY